MDIQEYERTQATLKLLAELARGEKEEREHGWLSIVELEVCVGVTNGSLDFPPSTTTSEVKEGIYKQIHTTGINVKNNRYVNILVFSHIILQYGYTNFTIMIINHLACISFDDWPCFIKLMSLP